MNKVLFSSNSDDWKTPAKVFDNFMRSGYIDLFPYKSQINQFDIKYHNKLLFCNPPFSQLDKVIDYLIKLYEYNNKIVLLMPSRTDTQYFHRLLHNCKCSIYFIEGRLKFNDSNSAPFPTLLVVFSKEFCLYSNYFHTITRCYLEEGDLYWL